MTELTCIVNIPAGSAAGLEAFLKDQGVDFSAGQSLIAINEGYPDRTHLIGHQIEDAARKINQYILENRELTARIETDVGEWSLETRQKFLRMAVLEFNWDERMDIQYDHWNGSQAEWQRIAQELPEIFQTRTDQD